jgi:hypothetical protein
MFVLSILAALASSFAAQHRRDVSRMMIARVRGPAGAGIDRRGGPAGAASIASRSGDWHGASPAARGRGAARSRIAAVGRTPRASHRHHRGGRAHRAALLPALRIMRVRPRGEVDRLLGGLGVGAAIHYYRELAAAHDRLGRSMNLVMVHASIARATDDATRGDRRGLAAYLAGLLGQQGRRPLGVLPR